MRPLPKTVDYIVDGLDSAKAAMIITTKPDEVAQIISDEFKIGLTLIEAKGYNSNENKAVLYAVVNQFQIVKLKTLIKSVDKDVYVTITMVSDIRHSSQELK